MSLVPDMEEGGKRRWVAPEPLLLHAVLAAAATVWANIRVWWSKMLQQLQPLLPNASLLTSVGGGAMLQQWSGCCPTTATHLAAWGVQGGAQQGCLQPPVLCHHAHDVLPKLGCIPADGPAASVLPHLQAQAGTGLLAALLGRA